MKRVIITTLFLFCIGISGLLSQSVTIISPNGGESLTPGTNYTIEWVSYGSSSMVDLYYSIDGGTTWLFINDNLGVSGTYIWVVPNVSSTTCLVKAQSAYVDQSDAYFTITSAANTVTVLSPNGGETWTAGTVQVITWSTTGSINYVEIWYSTDAGNIWNYIDDHAYNDGLFEWTIPNVTSLNTLIKINEFSNVSVTDVSNSVFEINQVVSNPVTVVTPNGGEVLTGGGTYDITWSSDGSITWLDFYYSTDGGNNWSLITDHEANDASYTWTVPNISSANVMIMITEFSNMSVYDISDAVFSINAISNSITVITPDGGEVWTSGTVQDITWSTTGSINYVEIWYSTDAGNIWNYIDDYSYNDGLYEWTVPTIATVNALIKINEVYNTSVSDVSNAVFEISTAVTNSITVLAPNGGEVLSGGSSYDITWSSTGTISYVEIYYSTDGGVVWNYIDDYSPNDGSYTWNVANVNTTNALIKIHEVFNPFLVDVSDAVFSINAVSNSVTVIAPNGGEVWTAGTVHNIIWSTTGTFTYGAVEIWYSADSGSTWYYIDDYTTNDGLFEWTVPAVATVNALIKINEVYNTSVVDVSNAVFEISTAVSNSITVLTPNGGEVLSGGSSYDITWSSTGTISYVEIYYSTDYGNIWNYIDDYSPNDGSYTWNVPNLNTTSALIKIHEVFNSSVIDYSDNTFTINYVSNSITIIAPNGGEVWTAGTTQDITWSTTGSINYVEIWYSTDAGNIWNYIDDHAYNDGLFEWNVPNVTSLNALIKINEFSNVSVTDVSNAVFEINQVVSNPVTVIAPNGGEVLSGGSTYDITWTSDGSITWLDFYYSTDGGQVWSLIADHEANDGSYTWTVPNISSANVMIMITEFSNMNIYDISDAVFSINAISNSVTVIAPNGGEVWTTGTVQDITWSTTGSINYVEIWYSTDAGNIWNYIDDYSYNDGLYEWTVPAVATVNALIKINEVYNTSVSDVSNAVFEISAVASNSITVLTPNGGEVLSGGSNYEITWSSTGSISNVEIYYSTDYGNIWNLIDDYSPNDGSHTWSVPNIYTTSAMIKIHEVFNSSVIDYSDNNFSINYVSNSITVIAPNGGEVWTAGTTQDITWSTTGSINYVEIWYSTDAGNIWNYIDDYSSNDGLYEWTVPAIATVNALIRINEVYNTSVIDVSNAVFEITSPIPNSITVIAPNGGEIWNGGTTQNITWSSTGSISYVEIYYSTDGGLNWNYIDDHSANDGLYEWPVINVLTTNALIKIHEFSNSSVIDESDSAFTINAIANTITVIAPNGGEVLSGGSTYEITWTSTGSISFVELWYSIDGGIGWNFIDDYSPNDSSYMWTVANVNTSNALVKVHEVFNPSVGDLSDAVFTINAVPNSVTVITPNGGEVWTAGTTQIITWSSTGSINYVDISLSTDNGQSWNYIGENIYNNGQYAWTVLNVTSVNALIKINDVYNTSVSDVSNAVFEISTAVSNSITVLTPNGGEVLSGGSSYDITWSSTGTISYVEIYYSTDYGNIWNYIDDYSPNDGSHSWNVPNINTSGAMIKIHEVFNSSVIDYSDNTFSINYVSNSITVLAPNGGEVLTAGTNQDITWSTTGSINYVEIWYSTDAGNIWNYIDDYSYNDGLYEWTVPAVATVNALIKINEVYNTSVSDVSNAVFEINQVVSNPVTVTAPNGGEVLTGGDTYDITWSSDGSITWLDFYYSTDGGQVWLLITDHEANDGSYTWTVPNISSANVMIMITEFGSMNIYDNSDAVFTINSTVINAITVTYPNGGEVLGPYSFVNITWTSVGLIDFVDLYYSIDNGSNWILIDDYVTNYNNYSWFVPNVATTNALVKVIDNASAITLDISDAVFEIDPALATTLTVITPNGGEVLTSGTTYDVTWSTTGTINNVMMHYSLDSGLTWILISDYILNTGLYSWTIPSVSSVNALIKITANGGSGINDISDFTFEIDIPVVNSLTLLTPNGGEVLTEGDFYNITWSSTGVIQYIELSYSVDNGNAWIFIDDYLADSGLYEWTIPTAVSSLCLVKVSSMSSAVDDESDSSFEIQPDITPGNGILLAQYYFNEGTVNDDYGSIDGERHGLNLVTDRFGCVNHAFKFGPNDGYIPLGDTLDNVFAAPDSSFAFSVWIKKLGGNSGGVIITKNSNGNCYENERQFTLSLNNNGKIKFVYHSALYYSAFQTIETNGTIDDLNWHHIVLNYDGSINTGGADRIEIYIDHQIQTLNLANSYGSLGDIQNGAAHLTIGSQAGTNGDPCGAYYFNGSLDDVRMYAGNLSSYDVSGLFNETLSCPANGLELLTPSSNGLILSEGDTYSVSWNTTGSVSNVDLFFSPDGGDNFTSIGSGINNLGAYSWTVPSTPSTNCLIRIEDSSDPTVIDESDNSFYIIENSLTVDAPNGGQSWDGLSTHYIWWLSTGSISFVDLYYTIDNGSNWILIASNLANGSYSTYYNWTVPNIGSTECKIKVEESGNPTLMDESDNTFTINYIAPELTLTSHNSGQTFITGSTSYISWQSQGLVNDINIYFSDDNSVSWSTIATNEINDGNYYWTIPFVNSTNCLIKIEDAIDPAVNDSSDVVFTISEAHSITVTYPNGGELIEAYSSDSVTWTSLGFFDYVDIYYSPNAGFNWYLVEDSVSNAGYYNWNVPYGAAYFLIKVEETGNSSIYDESDQIFEVGATAPIELLFPNGGEVFIGATIDSVFWDANGNSGFDDIMFSSDGGVTWSWEGDAPAQWEEVSWAIPNISSTTCLIAYGGDTSATYFTVIANLDSITVLSPNGGEVYQGGDTMIVTWDTTGCSNYSLVDFYFKNSYNFELRATVPNIGIYEYHIPNVGTTTAEVRLWLPGTTIYDDSDSPFTVNEIDINVLSPNGGEILSGNDSITITWSQTGIFDGVDLSYTPDNGNHWVDIEENVTGLSYVWTIPNISTDNCKVKVERVGVIEDVSDAVFTINNVPSLPWDSIHTLTVTDVQYHQWLSEDIGFYNADEFYTGIYCSSFHTINKTTDGGQTWSLTNTIPSSYQSIPLSIYGAWFFDANNGIAIGLPPQWNSHEWNTWSTSDGGMSWTLLSDTIFANFSTYDNFGMKDFEMLDANVGFANARTLNDLTGDIQDVIFLTIDGGLTWNVQSVSFPTYMHGGEFVNDSVGFVADNYNVYKTSDGGDTWSVSLSVEGGGVPKNIDFVNDSIGYVLSRYNGSYVSIIRTLDQGLTWDQRNAPPVSYVSIGVMDFYNLDIGLLSSTATGGASGIWRTSNGALTWETDSIASTVPMLKTDKASNIVMVNETVNYAVLSGLLIKAGVESIPPQNENPWAYTNTGNSHSILIPDTIPITIDGVQVVPGDYLGVFYDSLGVKVCAGYVELSGQTQSITVWGDDSQTSQPDGFAIGESFNWKIWRVSDAMEFTATATYMQPPIMPNTEFYAVNGMSGLISLEGSTVDYQYINIPQGWSFFSSYVDPFEPNIDSLCAPFISEVIIAKGGDGQTYWPQWGINLIGDILIGDGYQIKLLTAQTMTVAGLIVQPENTPFIVDQGWSFLGYLRQNEASIVDMLSTVVTEVIIVKNGDGQMYWPQFSLNLIGNMVPGQGYQIKMTSQQVLTYPSNSTVFTKLEIYHPKSIHYLDVKNTGNNMSLGLKTAGIEYGSEIGVFAESGVLIGSIVVEGEFTALSLWGDDNTTSETDGLKDGEEFNIKLWNGEEYTIEIDSWLVGDGKYEANKISIAELVKNSNISGFYLSQNMPNPFTLNTVFNFYLPVDCIVDLEIYNILGKKVDIVVSDKLQMGYHSIEYNCKNLSGGTYFYRLKTPEFEQTKKMVILMD